MADELSPDGNAVAHAIYQSLGILLGGDERFLITNDSMRHLIELYYKDFIQASTTGSQASLLNSWTRNAEFFHKEWLDMARQGTVLFNGIIAPVATESATFQARERCNKEKRRSAGPTRPASR